MNELNKTAVTRTIPYPNAVWHKTVKKTTPESSQKCQT